MKIENKKKILNFNKNFVVYGSKEDLLKFEEILKLNGINNDEDWNEICRQDESCVYLYVLLGFPHYSYHNHSCSSTPIDVEDFLIY